jgi:hypothetical protein
MVSLAASVTWTRSAHTLQRTNKERNSNRKVGAILMARQRKGPDKVVAYMRTSSATNVGTDKDRETRQRVAIEAFIRKAFRRDNRRVVLRPRRERR